MLDTSLSGTITVDPEGGLDLTSAAGTERKILCENIPITDITYDLCRWCYWCYGNRITSRSKFECCLRYVTISGTPTDDITTQTVYNYEITTTGSPCSGTATGTITVDPDDDLDLTSAVGTDRKYFVKQIL